MGLRKIKPVAVEATDDSTTQLTESVAVVQQQCQEILKQVAALGNQVSRLSARESQLRAVLERDAELQPLLSRLEEVLNRERTALSVGAAIDRATLHLDPFPYAVIDDLLPRTLYKFLLKGIPPLKLLGSNPNKQQIEVPFSLAPTLSHCVWRFMAAVVVPELIAPRIIEKFRAPIDEWITRNWPGLSPSSVDLTGTSGRIMLRRRGYRIAPHRDPKWGFITCILYLARGNDSEAWGTQIYAVDSDAEARGVGPYWIDPAQCRTVEDVAFRRNRVLVFLNSDGAHGAQIPADAEPENLERYIYQFRIGPTAETIAILKARLPEERQPYWAGKAIVDY
jgi:hypothetical protein